MRRLRRTPYPKVPLHVSETHFFCEFSGPDHSRLSAAVLYIVVDGFISTDGEETQEIAALAYGYAGGQTQSDYLFRRDGENGLWLYSDSSGGEWKGARTTSDGSHLYDLEIEEPQEWTSQDQDLQSLLEARWDEYFKADEDGDITVSEERFKALKQNDTIAQTDGFDMDILWDISPMTNFTTQYADPYYN